MKKLISSIAAVFFIHTAAVSAMACLARTPPPPSNLITSADVIVRATAVKYVKIPYEEMVELDFSSNGNIQFQVEEVLKGESVPALMIEGLLGTEDDFNDDTVPYNFVRPGGGSGRCEAITYKQGRSSCYS